MMGDVPSWLALVLGALLLWTWLLIGAGVVSLLRNDLRQDTWVALFNCLCWPAGLVTQKVYWPWIKRRRERARQERISVKVANGAYDPEFARDHLGWRG